jgi:hypothetical protein
VSLFNANILEIWLVYIFHVYHQHEHDKITSTKHFLAGQLDYRDIGQHLAEWKVVLANYIVVTTVEFAESCL